MQRLLQVKTLPLPNDFSKLDNLLFNKPEPKAKVVEVNANNNKNTQAEYWQSVLDWRDVASFQSEGLISELESEYTKITNIIEKIQILLWFNNNAFNLDILKHLRQAFYHQSTILGYTKVDIFIKTIFQQYTKHQCQNNPKLRFSLAWLRAGPALAAGYPLLCSANLNN